MLFSLMFVLMGDVPLREVVSLRRPALQGETHLGQLSRVSALQDVSCAKALGGVTCSPCIRREDKVDIPGVYEQWPKGDVFEVQSTVNQFQPSCVRIDTCVVFNTIEGLSASCKFAIRAGTDKKLTLGQFATSSALVSTESSNIERIRPRPALSFSPQPSNSVWP